MGVGASIAVHAIAALLIVLMPSTSVNRSIGPDTAAASSSQTRGFPGDTSSRIASRPRRPSPRTGAGANEPRPGTNEPGADTNEPGAGTNEPSGAERHADAGGRPVAAPRDSSLSGLTPETPGTASIIGRVMGADGRPVAGATIGYLSASGRQDEAQARYGMRSKAATIEKMPLARRNRLIDWLNPIDPQETYSGGPAAGVTDKSGTFRINVSHPDTYIVTVWRRSPPQIGSMQPVFVRTSGTITLPRPIALVDGWPATVDGRSSRVRAREMADDDPRTRSWGRQRQFFRDRNLTVVAWQEAQELLLLSDLRGGKEYLTGWLTIYTKSDDGYLTKPPSGVAFRRFAVQNAVPTEGFAPE